MRKIKTLCFAICMLCCSVHVLAMNHDHLVYNTVVENDMVVEKQVFKNENNLLINYLKYDYQYDSQNRVSESECLRWNDNDSEWTKETCIRYQYDGNQVTTSYYKWNSKTASYDLQNTCTVEDEITTK